MVMMAMVMNVIEGADDDDDGGGCDDGDAGAIQLVTVMVMAKAR